MSKPDWKDAPSNAEFLLIDLDGCMDPSFVRDAGDRWLDVSDGSFLLKANFNYQAWSLECRPSTWTPVTENLPDDLVTVWVSDTKTVGISEYCHGLQEWLYCEVVVDEVTHWQPIVYPDTP